MFVRADVSVKEPVSSLPRQRIKASQIRMAITASTWARRFIGVFVEMTAPDHGLFSGLSNAGDVDGDRRFAWASVRECPPSDRGPGERLAGPVTHEHSQLGSDKATLKCQPPTTGAGRTEA